MREEVQEGDRKYMSERKCRSVTGSAGGRQEVQEGDRKYMSERGSAGGRQEVQEGDRKWGILERIV